MAEIILVRDRSIALVANKEGTALHLLAQQKISNLIPETAKPIATEFAEVLLEEMLRTLITALKNVDGGGEVHKTYFI